MKQIVLATKNKGKIREFSAALKTIGIEAVPIESVISIPEPEETGSTFMENAMLKARYYCEACGLPSLADDSGLTVDALQGAPGVLSARYAGEHGDDEANNKKLISHVAHIPFEERTAQYVCALALVVPNGSTWQAEASCEGLIQTTAEGDGGFGYDPYFYVPSFKRTMAALSLTEKNKISHRGKALHSLLEDLRDDPYWNS